MNYEPNLTLTVQAKFPIPNFKNRFEYPHTRYPKSRDFYLAIN